MNNDARLGGTCRFGHDGWMDDGRTQRKPGDIILDRYMPQANPAEREQARENLYAFFGVLLRIATRRADEEIRVNGDRNVDLESGVPPPP